MQAAVGELAVRDAVLGSVVTRFGPPPLWGREPGFGALLRIILEQQVSLASARATYDRLYLAIGEPIPGALLALDDAQLKAIGFSRQKTRYARALSERIAAGQLDLDALGALDDEAVRAKLIELPGIGPWTAEIYLLMSLRRPDAWPAGDLALVKAIRTLYGLPAMPGQEEVIAMAERWRPWRAVAARVLWHFYLSGGAGAGGGEAASFAPGAEG